MQFVDHLVGLFTASITFTSVLIILYTFIRERQYDYEKREGVSSVAYEDLSNTIVYGVMIAFGSTLALFLGVVLSDPIYLTTDATVPATLAGIGLTLLLISVLIISCAFWKLASQELQ